MCAVELLVALACLVASASAGSSSCDIGQYWTNIPGALTWVSSGDAGVWGVNSADSIYYRVGTYIGSSDHRYSHIHRNNGFYKTDGATWIQVAGGLRQIDVGKDRVWGVNRNSHVYIRNGMNRFNPTGTEWQLISGLSASLVSVSDIDGKVWAIESGTGNVYRRMGISDELPSGSGWELVPGISSATSIDIGAAGVWATTANGNIYYRTGSRQDCQGSGWQQVPGGLKQIASGGDVVWGVHGSGSIWFRLNINSANPTGSEWIQVPGGLAQISVATTNNGMWGVNSAGGIYTRHQ